MDDLQVLLALKVGHAARRSAVGDFEENISVAR